VTRGEKDKLNLAKNRASADNNRPMQELSNERKGNHEGSADTIRNKLAAARPKNSVNKMGIRKLYKYQLLKSILDHLLAFLVLVILSPLLLFIAIVIKLDSPGDPILRQERIGKDGRIFTLYKFRSMYINPDDTKYKAFLQEYIKGNVSGQLSENKEDTYELIKDPRVTRFGAILRKTNLDELPQFFNILKGDMSIVGPRPDIPFAVAMYKDHHLKRLRVTPGITGLWQVSERKKMSFEDMIRLDIAYIERKSLLLDIKIMFLTVRTILKGDGS
jgi:lipopolysaccharide/colanic/teichoic acid biosynthesis glycosyltransferase